MPNRMTGSISAFEVDTDTLNVDDQVFTIYDQYGRTTQFTSVLIENFYSYGVQTCVNYGTQLGASVIMLIVVLTLTKCDKRNTPIFLLNTASLLVNVVRLGLQVTYFTSAWVTTYNVYTNDIKDVNLTDTATQVTASVLGLLLWTLIEISLALQVNVVCCDLSSLYRSQILTASCAVAVTTIGFQLRWCVHNIKSILTFQPARNIWLQGAILDVQTASTFWFCLAFATKLGCALYNRKKMGLRQFGAMDILVIMGCQTGMLPAIFAVLQYTSMSIPNWNSLIPTVIVLSLPLSTLWAATVVNQPVIGLTVRGQHESLSDMSTLRNPLVPFWNKLKHGLSIASASQTHKSAATGSYRMRRFRPGESATDAQPSHEQGTVA